MLAPASLSPKLSAHSQPGDKCPPQLIPRSAVRTPEEQTPSASGGEGSLTITHQGH